MKILYKFTLPDPPAFFMTQAYGLFMMLMGVVMMLAEIGLLILTFIANSWIPASVALGGIILSVIAMRIGEAMIRAAAINYVTKETELELDKRRKSGYN
jgi:uncharacterized membrane protein